MANLSIKNVPEELHQRLKERAEQHHRSINREVIACLEQALRLAPRSREEVESILTRVREMQAHIGGVLTEQDIQRAKESGRP